MIEQVRVRLNLNSSKDTTGNREAELTAEDRKMVGIRPAKATAAVSILGEGIRVPQQGGNQCPRAT